jgi:serine protease AprX
LRTYSSTQNTGAALDTFNIAAYATGTTQIRFAITDQQYGARYLFIDSVQITYAMASEFKKVVRANEVALTGAGVTVAVVDSGINPHFELQSLNGNSSLIANTSLLAGTTPADGYGHGTHVAGIIGGKGNLNPLRGGIAPDANLINVKVSDDNGMCLGSDMIAGLQWVYDNRLVYNIKVVNISMNSSVTESYQTSPIDAAVEILWFNGIVVVVSAGNSGSGAVFPPANDPFVITVGATDEVGTPSTLDDVVASFSTYGITEDGFLKPDLVAPGHNILSLLASTSASAYLNHPDFQFDGNYFRMSGTSMSAPVVSGAVALLLQDEPYLNPDQVKYRLMATANQQWPGYNPAAAGAGYLDIYAAVNGTTTQTANTGIPPSQLLFTGSTPITWSTVGWNSVGWNSVGWNSAGWNSVAWNSVAWNSVAWNSVAWNSVAWNSDYWGP